MTKTLKAVARDVLPPVIYRRARSIRGKRGTTRRIPVPVVQGELKPAEWYDEIYSSSDKYSTHYAESVYYPVWTVVADRISRLDVERVLDLGCGPGQFAALLFDRGVKSYRGLDFSQKSIQLARDRCPTYEFEQADISAAGVIESADYDCVVSLEFLEHVEDDVGILRRIAKGTQVLATVPNYQSAGHVRIFSDEAEVADRYRHHFSSFQLDPFLLHPRGSTLFLIQGTKA